MKNYVYVVYVGYYDFLRGWVEEKDSAYFDRDVAQDRVNDIINNNEDSWYETIQVLDTKKQNLKHI